MRRAVVFGVYLAGIFALIFSASTLLHEVAHAVVAWGFGARLEGVEIRPLGSGRAFYSFPAQTSVVGRVMSTGAGLALDCAIGSAALLVAWRTSRPHLGLWASLLGAVNLVHACRYLSLGLYHRVGDPGHIAGLLGWSPTPWEGPGLWTVALLMTPVVSFVCAALYLKQQERWFPNESVWRRLSMAVATAALAAFGLMSVHWFGERPPTVAFDTGPAPLTPFFYGAFALGACASIFAVKTPSQSPRESTPTASAALTAGLALGITALLMFKETWP